MTSDHRLTTSSLTYYLLITVARCQSHYTESLRNEDFYVICSVLTTTDL